MSTRKGANVRTRAQKYKNRTAFKNDLHDKTPQIKFINSLQVSEVCGHCKLVIEWKIKYKKYKPLSQPKTCNKCGERNVRKAYHVNCRDCSLKLRICAKCNKSADEVEIEPPAPTPAEKVKLDAELQQLIKKLPERKRRTFARYMKRGKKCSKEDPEEGDKEGENKVVDEKSETVSYTRDELIQKIEELKVSKDDEDEDDDDSFFDEEDDDDLDDDDFGSEEESELGSDDDFVQIKK